MADSIPRSAWIVGLPQRRIVHRRATAALNLLSCVYGGQSNLRNIKLGAEVVDQRCVDGTGIGRSAPLT